MWYVLCNTWINNLQYPLDYHDNYFGSQTWISSSGNTKQNIREKNYLTKMSGVKNFCNQLIVFDHDCKSTSDQYCICFLTLRMANSKCLEKSAKVGQEYSRLFSCQILYEFFSLFIFYCFIEMQPLCSRLKRIWGWGKEEALGGWHGGLGRDS